MNKIIVSIFGNSGSGKSTLAESVISKIGNDMACYVNVDYYLLDRNNLHLKDLGVDYELLKSHLSYPVGNYVAYPDYDFIKFERLSIGGKYGYRLKEIIVLANIHPYMDADIFVYLDISPKDAAKRVISRDPEGWEWRDYLKGNIENLEDIKNSYYDIISNNCLVLDAKCDVEYNSNITLETINYFKTNNRQCPTRRCTGDGISADYSYGAIPENPLRYRPGDL